MCSCQPFFRCGKILLLCSLLVTFKLNSIYAFNGFFNQVLSKSTSATSESNEKNIQFNDSEKASIVRLFSKLADSVVLVDLSAGKCCYGSCPGCDYLNDDGSYKYLKYSFSDKENVAAVIPPYVYRNVGDNEHTSKWSRVLFPQKQRMIKERQFLENLSQLNMDPVVKSLDPSAVNNNDNERIKEITERSPVIFEPDRFTMDESSASVDEWAAKILWKILARSVIDGKVGESLTKSQAANAFKKWSGSTNLPSEGICIESFEKGFLMLE